MRNPFSRKESSALPPEVTGALELTHGDKLLAAARDGVDGRWLAATSHTLALLDPAAVTEAGQTAVLWRRPWHEVDRASWDDGRSFVVSWADRSGPLRAQLGYDALFLQVVRERVQASVVLTQELDLAGRRTGRAVIRQDLATGDLLEQVVLGRGVREDAETEAAGAVALAWLREQVGMPPAP